LTITAAANSKCQKRDNIFSESRDAREDRVTRQVKTTQTHKRFFARAAIFSRGDKSTEGRRLDAGFWLSRSPRFFISYCVISGID
jgi:hypothetical protein